MSKLNDKIPDFLNEQHPQRVIDDLILSGLNGKKITDLISDQHCRNLLHSFSLSARHTLAIAGSHGNGKTSFVQALSADLDLPLYTVKNEELFGGTCAEIKARFAELLKFVSEKRCLLFFDDFDDAEEAVLEPVDTSEYGIKRLMLKNLPDRLLKLPDWVVVAVSAGYCEFFERAEWKDFEFLFRLANPDLNSLTIFIVSVFQRCAVCLHASPETLARKLEGCSFAEAEAFCLNAVRSFQIWKGELDLDSCINDQLTRSLR